MITYHKLDTGQWIAEEGPAIATGEENTMRSAKKALSRLKAIVREHCPEYKAKAMVTRARRAGKSCEVETTEYTLANGMKINFTTSKHFPIMDPPAGKLDDYVIRIGDQGFLKGYKTLGDKPDII